MIFMQRWSENENANGLSFGEGNLRVRTVMSSKQRGYEGIRRKDEA